MRPRKGESKVSRGWWATILVTSIVLIVGLSVAIYNRAFTPYVSVTLATDRAGLMLEPGGKVKLRGVTVGRVGDVTISPDQRVVMQLRLQPDQLKFIPANVEPEITASTAFGAKYVELSIPDVPSSQHLSAGERLNTRSVGTEVNTVFDNLVKLLDHVDPAKLNGILTALSQGLRGRGEQIGQATSASVRVLSDLNARNDVIRADFQSLKGFSDTYGAAAQDIITTLDAASTTSVTIADNAAALDALLLNVTGLATSGIDLLAPAKDNLVRAADVLEPTTSLLLKYNPEYTCLLVGAKKTVDTVYPMVGGNGRTLLVDAALLLGNDPYLYPDNLPIIGAKGGPGGKPGCGSLPDVGANFPVRQLVTNTGFGTGMDIRDNVGLGHPCYVNFFPVTRALPQDPSVRCQGPPSPGLVTPAEGPLPLPPPGPPTP